MVNLLQKPSFKENLKEMRPALAILLATLIISIFFTPFTATLGWGALWKTILRFLRLSLILTLPLLLLPGLCSGLHGLLNRGSRQLIQIEKDREPAMQPLKNWVGRSFQGLGLTLLIATKLLAFLEIYTGHPIAVDAILPPWHLNPWRFLSTTAIFVVVSLLLSLLWALDDLGIRHYSRKTQEFRMIGKYLGFVLPILFGFYGVISLLGNYPRPLAVQYLLQMVVILYPPFVVFAVWHARYLRKHEKVLLSRLQAVRANVLLDGKPVTPSGPEEGGRSH
jgi:hypothetical protein